MSTQDEELVGAAEAAHRAQIEGRLKELHTCLPGIVASFDPVTQTASVQPAIKRIFTERGAVALPVCVDVPVCFPGGGGFYLTFPVKAGDECTLHFSERCIDFWFANGGVQLPAEYRLHDLSDAFAFVGVNSQPRKIPSFAANDVELRDRGRTVRVTMKLDGTIENVNAVGSTVLSQSGKFTINAPGGFEVNTTTAEINASSSATIDTPATTMTGATTSAGLLSGQAGLAVTGGSGASVGGAITATGDITAGTISLQNHVHAENGGSGPTDPPS